MKNRLCVIAACTVALLGSIVSTSAQVPDNYPADYSNLIEAAKTEGIVSVYSPVDSDQARAVVDAFQAAYPGIKAQFTDIASVPIYNRVIAEAAAGQVGSDVVWTNAIDLQLSLVDGGYTQAYVSPEAAALPEWGKYKDSAYLTSVLPLVFIYNKELFKEEVPKTHADLLPLLTSSKQDLTGKVATYDPAKSGQSYVGFENDSRRFPQLWDVISAFTKIQGKTYGNAGIFRDKVASGEHVFAFNVNGAYARAWAKENPNIGVAFPTDYTVALSLEIFLTKDSPHPNAGKLFMDFVLSKQGQTILANSGLPSVRSDVDADSLETINELAGGKLAPVALDAALIKGLDPAYRGEFFKKWKQASGG